MVLEFDRLEKYPSDLLHDLVRVGNLHPENPNHFWNALFYAFKSYRSLTTTERLEYIQHQRETIADRIDRNEWLLYTDGFHAHRHILSRFKIRFLHERAEQNVPKDVAIVLRTIPNRAAFLEQVLRSAGDSGGGPTAILQGMTKSYALGLVELERKEGKSIPLDKRARCEQVFAKYIHDLWRHATDDAFHEFTDSIRDADTSIAFYMVPFILKYLDFHVFFMDDRTHDLISPNEYYEIQLRQRTLDTCVLLLYDGKSYESLGSVRASEGEDEGVADTDTVISKRTVRIQRLFAMSSEVAQICYKRLIR